MNPNFGQFGQPQPQAQPQAPAGMWGQQQPQAQAPTQGFNGFGGGPAPMSNGGGFHASAPAQLAQGDGAPISFNPATFTEGGMIDNVWVRFSNGRATTYDYKGKSSAGHSPAVMYDLQIVDANTHQPLPGTTPNEKVWTVGKLEDFQPRSNGVQFWSPTGKTGFNKSSNWATFIRAAIQAGIPGSVFDTGQVDALNGLVAFVQIVKTGTRDGMRGGGGGGKDGGEDKGTLVVTQIPGGARVNVAAVAGVAAPLAQAQPHAQAPAQAPIPQPVQFQAPQPVAQPQAPQQFQMPQAQPMAQAPQPMVQAPAPVQFQPQGMAQPQPQTPTAPTAPTAPTVDRAMAQRLLVDVLSTNPANRQAFNVALFSRTLTDEPLRNLVASPQFQAEMLGAPLNLA